jgi:hypothetical protein
MVPATRPSAKPSTNETATAAGAATARAANDPPSATTQIAATRAAYETATRARAAATATAGTRPAASVARESKLGVSRSRYKRRDQQRGCDRRKKLLHWFDSFCADNHSSADVDARSGFFHISFPLVT